MTHPKASPERLRQLFEESGTKLSVRADGVVEAENWPKPRWSSSTFLTDMVAEMAADEAAREARKAEGGR